MYHRHSRGQGGHQDARSHSTRGRHPNLGHPDHDACGTGFIARLGGTPSYDIIQFALTALERLTHRGGVDADGASGDGAGLLTSLPQTFFRVRAQEQGIELPEMFGVGFAFLPSSVFEEARAAVEVAADTERLRVIGWRRVPVNTNCLGRRALETMPEIWQFFVEPFHPARGAERFEWRLALLRKRAESLLAPRCYICSLSSQTIVYKGLLTPWQFPQFYEDLRDSSFATTFAVFHQRYSTNTQPSWHLAQPFRYVAHNGEINTIVSNRRWLRANGSETGLVDLEESRIAERQRLGPGEMILANPATGLFLRWREILKRLAIHQARNAIPQRMLSTPAVTPLVPINDPKRVAGAAGWSDDQFKILFSALTHGKEADWSMGDDAPPAFLSALPRTLWDYCKQRFAQVTNPPIDPLRETHVMSLDVHLKDGITLPSPVISAGQLSQLSAIFGTEQRIDITFPAATGVPGARCSFAQLSTTPLSGSGRPGLFLLSDRAIDAHRAPLPALLATAAVWKAMVREGLWDVPLIVESAQVFDTHHVALLVAAGASAVVPYLADEFAESLEPGGLEKARAAINAGLRKVQ